MKPEKQELCPDTKTKILWIDKAKGQWVAESGPEFVFQMKQRFPASCFGFVMLVDQHTKKARVIAI